MCSVYAAHRDGKAVDIKSLGAALGRPMRNEPKPYDVQDGVEFIPIEGILSRRVLLQQICVPRSGELTLGGKAVQVDRPRPAAVKRTCVEEDHPVGRGGHSCQHYAVCARLRPVRHPRHKTVSDRSGIGDLYRQCSSRAEFASTANQGSAAEPTGSAGRVALCFGRAVLLLAVRIRPGSVPFTSSDLTFPPHLGHRLP